MNLLSTVRLVIGMLACFQFHSLLAQKSPVTHSIFLIGDSGEPSVIASPIGNVLREKVTQAQSPVTILHLGDNIYPEGLPDPTSKTYPQASEILKAQVEWTQGLNAKAIFVPGNHDWQHWGKRGLDYIQNQQQWIDSLKDEHFTLLPRDGCPGPVEVPLNDQIVLIILDTQWFLHQWDKPAQDGPCEGKTTQEVLALLHDIFQRNIGKRIIVAAHHPLITYGAHGGVFTLKEHIFPFTQMDPSFYFPLPVLGSIYVYYRKLFGHIQDAQHPVYKEFAQGIRSIMSEFPGSVYVAGHEHALEYIVRDSVHYIVSGAGSKTEHVKKKRYAHFAENVKGFSKVSLHEDGSLDLTCYQVDEDFPSGKEIFSEILSPIEQPRIQVEGAVAPLTKTIRIKASDKYTAGKLKKKLFGENYREEWSTEIEVPVFDIGNEKGGLKILQRGGGQQTLSLRLEASDGKEYVVRSVEKFPEGAVPEMLRKTFAQDLVQDQISAAHPYGALVIAGLADAAGIYHTNPKLMFIPDDPRLGEYRHDFANTLVIFEERPAGNWESAAFFGNSEKIINTAKVLEKLSSDNDNQVDQEFVLRSRLFDMVIGDWDRHDDQWRWATTKDKKKEFYRPIPRDRDQAFFVNEGIIGKIWSRKWALPKFEGFDADIDWPSGLSFNARYFDRSFLTALSKDDWIRIAEDLRNSLTDEVIERSIRQWPREIFEIHGERIIRNLKSRRDKLADYAIAHYEYLAKQVDVVGSDKRERIDIERLSNGDSQVKIFKISRKGKTDQKLYDRVFHHKETKEIRIYGLGGDDIFKISGSSGKAIRVRVIGGDGQDSVSSTSKQVLFYDLKGGAKILSSSKIKDKTADDPIVNTYDRKSFQYNRLAPLILANYNPDDGIFIGGGFVELNYGFRKQPFKQRHLLLASMAPATQSYNIVYKGVFTDVIGKWAFLLNADIKSPNYVNNFFGLGNESVYDRNIDDQPGMDVRKPFHYYRYRFEELRLDASLSRKIGKSMSVSFGPTLQRIEMEEPSEDRFIREYAATLPYNLFDEYNAFAGAQWQFSVDRRDHERFTHRGMTFNLSGRNMAGLNKMTTDFSSYEGSISLYHSFRQHSRLVFAARVGAGLNTGNYAFYQAQVLDGKTELRGYRKTRFYGDQKFYSNFEMRLRLLSFRSYLFPASMGILGFHDLGRVWYKDTSGEDPTAANGRSTRWHKGWGGGLWFTPFNLAVLSTEVAYSADGMMGYVRLGFLF